MTGYERITNAFAHKKSDRTPCFEYVLLSPIADLALGEDFIEYSSNGHLWQKYVDENGFEKALRRYAEQKVAIAEIFGHDLIYCSQNPLPPNAAPMPEIKREKYISSEKPSDDPDYRVRERNRQTRHFMPFRYHDDTFLIYDYIREAAEKRGLCLDILVPTYAHGIWTDTDLMQTIILDPDAAAEHFALATERSLPLIKKFAERGIRLMGVGGDFAGNRLMISPQAYAEIITPELRRVTDYVHSLGCFAVNASDGNLWEVIDDFLVNSGTDAYLEIDSRSGMDFSELKKRYPDKTYFGNIDCGEVLSFWSPDEIRKEVFNCLETGGGEGHIFCASNAITHSVPVGNYLAMVNAYKDYFGLAKISI